MAPDRGHYYSYYLKSSPQGVYVLLTELCYKETNAVYDKYWEQYYDRLLDI